MSRPWITNYSHSLLNCISCLHACSAALPEGEKSRRPGEGTWRAVSDLAAPTRRKGGKLVVLLFESVKPEWLIENHINLLKNSALQKILRWLLSPDKSFEPQFKFSDQLPRTRSLP